MAPFKLKFRMGGSRSTSQEVDADPQANQSLLNNSNIGIGASNSTLDSTDCTSLGSLANDKRSLLPNTSSNNEKTSYLNPVQTTDNAIPHSPPPTYEHVLEENRLANLDRNLPGLTGESGCSVTNSGEIKLSLIQKSSRNTSFEQITQQNTCTDPACNIVNDNNQEDDDNRKESIDSTECLISTTMTTPSSHGNLLECTGSCDPLFASSSHQKDGVCKKHQEQHYSLEMENQQKLEQSSPQQGSSHQNQHEQEQNEQQEYQSSGDEDDQNCSNEWNSNNYQQEQTSEIISNKSSKQIYKAVAKQWGITCKMSDQCRCMECQSHYFDCEFDENDHQKTDGGLGAGTPMFISEVMHGTACTIL